MADIFDMLNGAPPMQGEEGMDTSAVPTPSAFGSMPQAPAPPSLMDQIPGHLQRMIEQQQKRSEWADSLLRGMLTENQGEFEDKALGRQGMSTGMKLLQNVLGGMAAGSNWGAFQQQRIQLAQSQREAQKNALSAYIANNRADQAAMSQMANFLRNMQKDQELNQYRQELTRQQQERINLEVRKQEFNESARTFGMELAGKKNISTTDLMAARTKLLELEAKAKEAGITPKTRSEFIWELAKTSASDPAAAKRIFDTLSRVEAADAPSHRPFAPRLIPETTTDLAGNQTTTYRVFNPNSGAFSETGVGYSRGLTAKDRAAAQDEVNLNNLATGAITAIQDAMKSGVPFGQLRGIGPVRTLSAGLDMIPIEEQNVYKQVGLLGPTEVKKMSGVQFSMKELSLHQNNHPQTTNAPEQMLRNAIITGLLTQASIVRRRVLGNRDLNKNELERLSLDGEVLRRASALYAKHQAGQEITPEDISNAVNEAVGTVLRTPATAPLPATAPPNSAPNGSPNGSVNGSASRGSNGKRRIVGIVPEK